MRFRYRYVGFGTGFSAAAAPRIATRADERDQGFLRENELAVDVGGVCWGHGGVDQPVIDHHFHRADGGQFPSAAAAVLHLAPRIVDRFGGMDGDLCLVTHREPDFDAFCAMYLARCLLEGNIPSAGWDHYGLKPHGWSHGKDEIDWFQPRLNGLPPKYRWPVLLAAYAACVDNGRQLACPRSRSLHSILYAAIVRGRDYLNEDSGALEFFQEVTRNIEDPARGLNPLIDSVLERSETFAPERAMLESEEDAYRRDLRRARPAIVFLQESRVPFPEWFPKLQAVPLLKEDGSPEPVHLRPPDQGAQPGRRDLSPRPRMPPVQGVGAARQGAFLTGPGLPVHSRRLLARPTRLPPERDGLLLLARSGTGGQQASLQRVGQAPGR